MDFGVLPPEINSGRMYAGPGAGPMLTAAAAWADMASELHYAAAAYASTIEGLAAGTWHGPTAIAMAAAAGPYVSWISATATRADQAAAQAALAAAAYESAFVATVPPPVVAANRAQLSALIATNIFGQNTPAIAATEAQYLEMWAQDAVAMYSYAAASADASQLTPFTEPPQTTSASGTAAQAATVSQIDGMTAGSAITTQLSELVTSVPSALQGLATAATPVTASGLLPLPSLPADIATGLTHWNAMMGMLAGAYSPFLGLSSLAGGPFLSFGQTFAYAQNAQGLNAFFAPKAISGALAPIAESLGPHLSSAGSVGGAASGAMGRAALVGSLSVPQGWTTAAPAIRTVAASLATNLAAAAATSTVGEAGVFGEMALAGLAGRAFSAAAVGSGGSSGAASSLGGVIAQADPAAAMIFVLPALED